MKKFGVIILIVLVILGSAQCLNHSVLSADIGPEARIGQMDGGIAYTSGSLFSENQSNEDSLPLAMTAAHPPGQLPEPAILFLLGIGMLGLASFRRRFKN